MLVFDPYFIGDTGGPACLQRRALDVLLHLASDDL